MNKTYYIFRHGETYATKARTIYDKGLDPPILDEGIPTIEKMAEFLGKIKSDENYTSEYLRCRMTSGIIAKKVGKKFKTQKALNEYSKDNPAYDETFDSLQKRLTKFTNKLLNSKSNTFMICTHGNIITILAYLFRSKSFVESDFTNTPRPGVLIIVKNGKVTKKNFN